MLGLIVTAGSAINLIFTFVLGIANDVFGAHASFYLVPLGLLVFSVSSFFIYLRQNTSLSENLFGKSDFSFSTKELLYVYHIV